MSDGVRADIIYYNTSSDWLFESELYSKYYSLRLLTAAASSKMEAIKALGRALTRSETVIVVGGWQGESYLPATIAKAVGVSCQRVGLPGSAPEDAVLLPSGAMPLTAGGRICGAILCRGPQAIVMVDDEREGRVRLAKDFIAPYLIKQAGLLAGAAGKSEPAPEPPKPQAEPEIPTEKAEAAKPAAPSKSKPATEPTQSRATVTPRRVTPSVEEIPMERVRLVLPQKKAGASSALPELKFKSSLPVNRPEKPAEEPSKPVEEKAVESVKPKVEAVTDPVKPKFEPVAEPEKPKPTPVVEESKAEPLPKPEKSVIEIPTEPKAKREKAEKPAKSAKKETDAAPPKSKKKAAVKPVSSAPTDEVEDADEGITLPKFGKVLTAVLVILLLCVLAAGLYVGYEYFVPGGAEEAAEIMRIFKR